MSTLTAPKPRLRKAVPEPDRDAEFLRDLFMAIIEGSGRGALTFLSTACGAPTVSHFRKRLRAKHAFCPLTMRAILLAQELKAGADEPLTETTRVGAFTVGFRADDSLGWRHEL